MTDKIYDFTHVGADANSSEEIKRESISYWKDAMRRLMSNKTAVVCMIILAFIIIMAIFMPMISKFSFSDQRPIDNYLGMFERDSDGNMHVFGTDILGRDQWVRIWSGARISLTIAFSAVLINCIIGALYGGIAGYFGGSLDNIMMRIVEIIIGVPYLMVVILLMMIMKAGVMAMIVAYATVGWTQMARLVRGQVMQLKEQEFVMAAKVMGASSSRIILKHLLPNALSVIIVNITLAIPAAIFTESFLSFIGLGVPLPQASWGSLASNGVTVLIQHPAILFVPAFFISITMLAFNLLGDAMRDAFDPKLRR